MKARSAMQIPVAVEPTSTGLFRAQSLPPFAAVAEGATCEEAIAKVRAEISKEIESGKKVVMVEIPGPNENPWLAMAGWLKDDPLFDEWQAAIEEFRQLRDIEDGIEYRGRE